MKTKEEILKMSRAELIKYKWQDDFNPKEDTLSNCLDCFNCFHCSDCYLCRNASNLKYAICNVEMTKEEYENKMKELNIKEKQ